MDSYLFSFVRKPTNEGGTPSSFTMPSPEGEECCEDGRRSSLSGSLSSLVKAN